MAANPVKVVFIGSPEDCELVYEKLRKAGLFTVFIRNDKSVCVGRQHVGMAMDVLRPSQHSEERTANQGGLF